MKKIKIHRRKLNKYFKEYDLLEEEFLTKVMSLQGKMQQEFDLSNLEFFFVDGEMVGIGTPDTPEKMKLVHRMYKIK